MNIVSSIYGPKKVSYEDEVLDIEYVWKQGMGLSRLLIEFDRELGDKLPKVTPDLIFDINGVVVDPGDDWKIELGSLPKRSTLNQKMCEHYLASNRQLFYFERLYNKNRPVELCRLSLSEKSDVLSDLCAKMMMCIVWGYWHYYVSLSTYVLLRRNNSKRGAKGGKGKANWREESSDALRTLVKGRLRNRPEGGWPMLYDTARQIATDLKPLLQDVKIDIPEEGDDLAHRIDMMIKDDLDLKRLHDENR